MKNSFIVAGLITLLIGTASEARTVTQSDTSIVNREVGHATREVAADTNYTITRHHHHHHHHHRR